MTFARVFQQVHSAHFVKAAPGTEAETVDNMPDNIIDGDIEVSEKQMDELLEEAKHPGSTALRKRRQFDGKPESKWQRNIDYTITDKLGLKKLILHYFFARLAQSSQTFQLNSTQRTFVSLNANVSYLSTTSVRENVLIFVFLLLALKKQYMKKCKKTKCYRSAKIFTFTFITF